MKVVIGLLLAAVAVGAVYLFAARETRPIYCGGSFPAWMLEAQDYDNSGCAEVLPSEEAPPDADWRMYCTGLCDPDANPSDVSFPRADGNE